MATTMTLTDAAHTVTLRAMEVDAGCRLLELPDELLVEIASAIDRRRDLFNLSLTCQKLEDVCIARLYNSVDVSIPQAKSMRWNIGALPTLREHVVQATRSLVIRDGAIDMTEPMYGRPRQSDAGSVEDYALDVVSRVPVAQLKSFSYLHRSPLQLQMLDLLSYRHNNSLKELRFFEIEPFWKMGVIFPNKLRALECRSVAEGQALGKIVGANAANLEVLRLGQEKELVEQYRLSRIGFLEQITQPLDAFTDVMKLQSLPRLRELCLYGLDVSSLIPTSIPEAMLFCRLETLTLESCSGSAALLETLASTFHFAQTSETVPRTTPQLKKFSFRHEAPTTPLKDGLIRFLASFRGLKALSLLFENATFLERPSVLIAEHGTTLETLVLESRIQPREHLGLDTSRPFGVGGYSQELWEEAINDICSLCPNLVELGMGFPWDDEMVRIRKTRLPSLRNLRTMHIRNFPESQVLSQLGDYSIKEYAQRFTTWVYPPLLGGEKPALETLAIGPTLYESRWRSSIARRQPPEYLRTHHFCVDWAKTRFGRWSPLVTGVSEKYMEELKGQTPLGGVFEQVWLR